MFYRLLDDAVADTLAALLGPAQTGGPEVLAACQCPHCSEAIHPDTPAVRVSIK